MIRDFSEEARTELLNLVKRIEDSEISSATDWASDRWLDMEAWIGKLDIKDYLDDVTAYHRKVIDKNNSTKDDIIRIFEDVSAVDSMYGSRQLMLLAELGNLKRSFELYKGVLDTSNEKRIASPEYIRKGLLRSLSESEAENEILKNMWDQGLSSDDLVELSSIRLQSVLDSYIDVFLDYAPDLKLGERLEIPIGYGISMYYSLGGKVKGRSDAEISMDLDEQRFILKSISYDANGVLSFEGDKDGEGSITVKSPWKNISAKVDADGTGYRVTSSFENGQFTVTGKYDVNIVEQKLTFEESVTTALEGGSVSSALGIKYKSNGWKPLAESEPVTSPYTDKVSGLLPTAAELKLAGSICAATLIVVGGAALAAESGGASLASWAALPGLFAQ